MEGVMIRGYNGISLSVRLPDGSIVRRRLYLPGWSRGKAKRFPFARGILVMLETLIMGLKTLDLSARLVAGEETTAERGMASKIGTGVTFAVSIVLGIGLFFLLPLYLSELVENTGVGPLYANIVEGAIRLGIFIGYLWGIGFIPDVRRVFGYHGAEHMTIAAIEAGRPLDTEEVRRFPREHPRCGTSFLLTVVIVSVIVFSLLPREPLWLLVSSRIVLIPFIAALSYEIIRYAGTHSGQWWVRYLVLPNLLTQKMTTRVPDDSMIEVAMDAMRSALALDGYAAYSEQNIADIPEDTS